jgi:hypothetical protein
MLASRPLGRNQRTGSIFVGKISDSSFGISIMCLRKVCACLFSSEKFR